MRSGEIIYDYPLGYTPVLSYAKRTPEIALEIMTMWGMLRLVPINLAQGKLKVSPITNTSVMTNT